MRRSLIKAAAFSLFMSGSSLALANECGLNQAQLDAGWQCVAEYDTIVIPTYEQAGQSHMCQYFESEQDVVRWVAYNPGDNSVPGHSTDWEADGDPSDPVKVGGNVVCPS
jgi:hypothetical protein